MYEFIIIIIIINNVMIFSIACSTCYIKQIFAIM